jgi:hypothetical protein
LEYFARGPIQHELRSLNEVTFVRGLNGPSEAFSVLFGLFLPNDDPGCTWMTCIGTFESSVIWCGC